MDSTTPPQLSAEEQEQRANQLNSDQQQRQLEEKEQERTEANARTDQLNDLTGPAGLALSIINFRKIRAVNKEIKKTDKEIKKATGFKKKLTRKLLRKKIRIFFEALSGIGVVAAIGEATSLILQSEQLETARKHESRLIEERKKLEIKKYNLENFFKRQEEA